jgi:RimJ/RimL family protein N-acetyltransferase
VTRESEEQAVLTTVRLVLRRPAEGDLPSIVKHANDWEVARLLGRVPHPYSMDDARFFLEKVVPNELTWAITSRVDNAFMGVIGLAPGARSRVAELGYWLGRCFWGNGFATEAGSAVVQYAFRTLGLARLTSGYFIGNLASDRVLTKLGFVRTGEDERQCLAQRKAVRSVEMELAQT